MNEQPYLIFNEIYGKWLSSCSLKNEEELASKEDQAEVLKLKLSFYSKSNRGVLNKQTKKTLHYQSFFSMVSRIDCMGNADTEKLVGRFWW